jgi:Tfp pilus assembly protein FimT
MELMVVIAILAIMAGMSMSALSEYIPDYRLNAAVRTLVADLHKAKTEAIKVNKYVTVVFDTDESSPSGGIGSYVAFIDNGAGGGNSDNHEQDGDELILMKNYIPKNVVMSSETSYNYVIFDQYGLPNTQGNIILRNIENEKIKITINETGYIDIKNKYE